MDLDLLSLALLACPLAMIVMMVIMGRAMDSRRRDAAGVADEPVHPEGLVDVRETAREVDLRAAAAATQHDSGRSGSASAVARG